MSETYHFTITEESAHLQTAKQMAESIITSFCPTEQNEMLDLILNEVKLSRIRHLYERCKEDTDGVTSADQLKKQLSEIV